MIIIDKKEVNILNKLYINHKRDSDNMNCNMGEIKNRERVELKGYLSEFREALEEEIKEKMDKFLFCYIKEEK